MATTQAKKVGRPRKDPDLAIGRGIMSQVRFGRAFHRRLKLVAKAEHMPMTSWIRKLCEDALAARE